MALAFVIVVDPLAAAVLVGGVAVALWLAPRMRRRPQATGRGEQRTQAAAALQRDREFAESQGRFVATLTEEIRAPLATALIHAELLLASCSEPLTVERYAQSLVEDVRHLNGLVDSYLRLAAPLAQDDTSRHVPVHVHDIVLAAARRCRFVASTRDVALVPHLAAPGDGAPVEVLGDAVLLEAMIENLVRNGVLSAPRGARVEVRVELLGDEVRVAVLHPGAPIDSADAEEAFRGFFEVPPPARAVSSAGLSLAIAMRVAEHHRGTISLANVPEGGCRFEVQLPRWSGAGRQAS
jgi:signal transduction histidine kinase